ncbi:uncharacterized protein BDZ99DRAFT_523296 [Mytilinidion resinicola]|uniref:Uncharacterized protein n=1 Tax=Mytilinidion resinicola TaxID=574789 RepID=A0A6A6YD25_9PEZI|nr:uncharacterized protein BDZ99DRAFT_523296 [Mytilinidion resinicola]KAF2806722.1 hypothetical protein BDZ99DRAFT_523296 [Mytilinidion resinicola]
MQIAEILSDLTSLRVCDPAAALSLVSARPHPSPSSLKPITSATKKEDDTDLKRAKDLVELHYAVKVAHGDGEPDQELVELRGSVRRAVGAR